MKRTCYTSLLLLLLSFLPITTLLTCPAEAATVGNVLTSPEAGFRRINNTDPNIIYENSTYFKYNFYSHYYYDDVNNIKGNVKLRMFGSKFRLLTYTTNIDYVNKLDFYVDGQYYSSFCLGKTRDNYLIIGCDIQGLNKGFHNIEIVPTLGNTRGINIDAIDIDNDGYLVPYTERETKAKIKLDYSKININTETEASISISNDENFTAADIILNFNPLLLKITSITPYENVRLYKAKQGNGTLRISTRKLDTNVENLIKIKFKGIGAGNAYLNFNKVELAGEGNRIFTLNKAEYGAAALNITN